MQRYFKLVFPVILFSSHASASALYFYEVGGEDVGLAAAGIAARAQDASVLAVNPAGLSHVEGQSFTGGAQLIYGNVDYTVDSTDRTANDTVGSFPSVSAFYSQQIDSHWTAGVGLYGNFGSSLDFDDTLSLGPTNATVINSATSMALTLAPTVSYRINEQWSVGAGVGINYGIFKAERRGALGDKNKADDHDVAFNGKVGVLYEYDANTRVGLGYTSETNYDYDLDGLVEKGAGLNTTIVSPQQIMLSLYHKLTSDWALMGNIGWQDWSRYADSDAYLNRLGNGNINLVNGSRMQDTYHLAVGSQYQVNPDWVWNFGVAFDSSAFDDRSETSLTVPAGNEVRIGTGVEYAIDDTQSIGAAMEYLYSDDTKVKAGPISGSYESRYYFFTVHYSWKSI